MSERLAAIMGGGDWNDASVDHVVIPADLDLQGAHNRYRAWYRDVYSKQPQFKPGQPNPDHIKYLTFPQWLVKHEGARAATDADVIEWYD